jgi:hypothetical protein
MPIPSQPSERPAAVAVNGLEGSSIIAGSSASKRIAAPATRRRKLSLSMIGR